MWSVIKYRMKHFMHDVQYKELVTGQLDESSATPPPPITTIIPTATTDVGVTTITAGLGNITTATTTAPGDVTGPHDGVTTAPAMAPAAGNVTHSVSDDDSLATGKGLLYYIIHHVCVYMCLLLHRLWKMYEADE